MPQYFHRDWNARGRLLLVGTPAYVIAAGWLMAQWVHMPYFTGVGVAVEQPIAFSHEYHVGLLEIDCRYCHSTVDQASFAGMPATATCLGCHEHVWTGLSEIQPLKSSAETGIPIAWRRVHDVPDYAFFDHGIHVQKGVACVTCHGRVDRMPQVWKTQTLSMQWCLECHREPERYVRPREFVFDLEWEVPSDRGGFAALAEQLELQSVPRDAEHLGRMLVERYDIQRYTSCSNCHQ